VTLLNSRPLTALPRNTQAQIRTAVEPAVEAITRDPSMGLKHTRQNEIALGVVPVANAHGRALYAVSWNDKSFGVNGAVWIVEVTPRGVHNLVPPAQIWGWGIEVLSDADAIYPQLMIASKGEKLGGAGEAEPLCMKKTGAVYESVGCPSTCMENLNSR
jgi:hypothetical protein